MAEQVKTSDTIITKPSQREVQATRVFDAPRELVWAAHTECDRVRQWLLGPEGWTMPTCEIDLRPGGKWRYVYEGPAGEKMEMSGEYREVIEPERIVNSTVWGGNFPDTIDSLTLEEQNGKTFLTASVLWPSEEARDAAMATGMEDGWSQSYDRLEAYLRSLR